MSFPIINPVAYGVISLLGFNERIASNSSSVKVTSCHYGWLVPTAANATLGIRHVAIKQLNTRRRMIFFIIYSPFMDSAILTACSNVQLSAKTIEYSVFLFI